ncbi:hypothetical protein DINM_020233 [Dirofilaria immitis]|nr:hypothetical protein [Dirofilaria immitis]
MAKNEKVGKAIATAHVKDERDVPDYEFPDSGHVKLNLTLSDVAVLERTDSESDMRSKLSSSPIVMKKQIVQIRFIATVAVLLSLGFICLLLNCFVWHAIRNAEMEQILLGILAFVVGISTRDWYRLHGEKLTRALKALLNVPNMLNTFEIYFSGDPKINAAIPRTPEISPPLSPPNLERNETRSMATTTS